MTVTVDDGVGGVDDQTLQWDIAAVNVDPEVSNPGDQSDNEADTVSLTISATDADGDVLTYGATGLPAGLTINPSTGQISGTIATGASTTSPYTTQITITDATTTIAITFTWTVDNVVGAAPVVRYDFVDGSGVTVSDSGSGVPLDLTISDPGAVSWVSGGGLRVDSATVITSGGAATKVYDAVAVSNEMTVEAWVTPANVSQGGPARIVASAVDPFARNFMLGQGAWSSLADDTFGARLRTTSSLSGQPDLFTPAGTATTDLTHVVMTRTAAGAIAMYVNGVVQGTQTRAGDFSNWNRSYPLVVANVGSGARPWVGTLCQIAIYDQALDVSEVNDNYTAGCAAGANTGPVLDPIAGRSDAEGDTVSVGVVATDDDGDVLTYDATGLPDGLTIDASTGTMSGTLSQTAAAAAPYAVTVTVDDGRGGSASQSFDWAVTRSMSTRYSTRSGIVCRGSASL